MSPRSDIAVDRPETDRGRRDPLMMAIFGRESLIPRYRGVDQIAIAFLANSSFAAERVSARLCVFRLARTQRSVEFQTTMETFIVHDMPSDSHRAANLGGRNAFIKSAHCF